RPLGPSGRCASSRSRPEAGARQRATPWKLIQQPQRRFRHPARRVVAAQLLIEGSQLLFQAKLSKILQVKEMPAVEIGFRAPEPQRFIQRSGLRGRKSDLAQTLLGFAGS